MKLHPGSPIAGSVIQSAVAVADRLFSSHHHGPAGAARVEALEGRALLSASPSIQSTAVNRPDHIVIVIEQDRASDAIGSAIWSYLNNTLAATGLVYSNSHGVTHPSTPNTLALYSGSTQGITDNGRNHSFTAPNLAKALFDAGLSFSGYVENLPADGSQVAQAGDAVHPDLYTRNVNAMAQFTDVGIDPVTGLPRPNAAVNRTFGAFTSIPTADYSSLPTVSFIVPNNLHSSHGSNEAAPWAGSSDEQNNDILRKSADDWLRDNLDAYFDWARDNNSLLIVTQDEERWTGGTADTVTTVVNGDPDLFDTGVNSDPINHYNLLRTITDMYGLSPLGVTGSVAPLDRDSAGQLLPDVTTPGGPIVANAGGPYTVTEGQGVVLSAAGTTGPAVTFEWDFDYDGVTFGVDATGISPTLSGLDGPASRTVAVRASGQGVSSIDTATVTIVNAAPTASFAAGGAVTVGAASTVAFTAATDPSTTDVTAGLRYSFDFNADGDFTDAGDVLNSTTTTATYTFPTTGTFNVRGRVTDKDNGFTDYTTTVTVNPAPAPGTPVFIEAETGLFGGDTGKNDVRTGYTGTGYVDYGGAGSYAQWTVTRAAAGDATIGFRYANGDTKDRPLTVYLNGLSIGTLAFAPTGSWTTWKTVTINATLAAGSNTIRAVAGAATGANIDSLTITDTTITPPPPPPAANVPVTVQAETATLGGSTVTASNYAGYTGTGYADFGGKNSYVQFVVNRNAAGPATITLRYANGGLLSSRPVSVSVNGVVKIAKVSLGWTGGWTTWKEVTLSLDLTAGDNTIRLTNTTRDGVNLDSVSIA
jgi:hypothetical protein